MATITSQAELNAIINNLDWSNHVWLGGSDSATEGEWFWVTGPEAGTQFYSDNDPSLTTFENFRSDQPSNSIGGQHYANVARLYYDFEDLANGPVYEYGMALDVKF